MSGDNQNVDEVRQVEVVDNDHVATIVLAFDADPFVRWMMPSPEQFVACFSEVTRLHGERCAANGGAWAFADGRAAAFWYPPGVHPDGEALGAVLQAAGASDRVASLWQAVADLRPATEVWYLRQIGVDPTMHGKGRGSALLAAGLAEVDRLCATAYLEATTLASRALYERHGFETLGEVTAAGSPPLWPMAREAR